jgi:hypothetical protein
MSKGATNWFPPGYRSILDLVDEIGREIHGDSYWPDHPPSSPQMSGTSPDVVQTVAGILAGHPWWEQCNQHRRPARDRLRTKLAAGEIEAFVLCSVHGDVPIEPKWWRGDAAVKTLRAGKAELIVRALPIVKGFGLATASGPVGVRITVQHQNSTAGAEFKCQRWLAEHIRSRRYGSKQEYCRAAQASIGKLSAAAFGRVWRKLAEEPGNDWMMKAGRRRSRSRIK